MLFSQVNLTPNDLITNLIYFQSNSKYYYLINNKTGYGF